MPEEELGDFIKAFGVVADKILLCAVGFAVAQQTVFLQHGAAAFGGFAAGTDECDVFAHDAADGLADDGVMRAAQNECIYAGFTDGR